MRTVPVEHRHQIRSQAALGARQDGARLAHPYNLALVLEARARCLRKCLEVHRKDRYVTLKPEQKRLVATTVRLLCGVDACADQLRISAGVDEYSV